VIGIEGEDVGITILGDMAQKSGGDVNIVNPLELQRKMRQIIDNPVIATDVKIKLITHPYLGVSKDNTIKQVINEDFGNVTAESDFAFEFSLSAEGLKARDSGELKKFKNLPVQVQVHYRKLDSTKCLRIISAKKPISFDREKAEKYGDVAVLAVGAVQSAAKLALNKEYKEARKKLFVMQQLLDRLAQSDEQQEEYDIFIKFSQELDSELKSLTSSNTKVSDKAAKCFYTYRTAPKIQFLAGSRKDISTRKKHVGEIKKLNI